eukprot:6188667-Pleurochrysis_carterae.AAC.2
MVADLIVFCKSTQTTATVVDLTTRTIAVKTANPNSVVLLLLLSPTLLPPPFTRVPAASRYDPCTAQAFDAHTGTSALIRARMCAPRSGAGAAFGADGALYLAGGSRDGACMIADCERYDQREGTWQRLAALPTARGYLSATFALDGRLYVAGGSEDGGWALDLLEAYEPRKDRWVTLAPLPKCRANLAAVLVV